MLKRSLHAVWRILSGAAYAWIDDGAPSMGASIAFYTIFSLAPILILVIAIAGMVFGEEAATGALVAELGDLVGKDGAETMRTLVANASRNDSGSLASALGIVTLLVGATTVFAELQYALNRIWKAEAPPSSTVVWLVTVRLRGLALIAALGFLMLVSLVVTAALTAAETWLAGTLPDWHTFLRIANTALSWVVVTVLFALIYRVLPDTSIPWADVWLGAVSTATLFTIGRYLIGLYLGTSGLASTYGAAGSFVLILLWVYYSAQIFLFGAEITRVYSETYGSRAHRTEAGSAAPRP